MRIHASPLHALLTTHETAAADAPVAVEVVAFERRAGAGRGAPTVVRINALAQSLVASNKVSPPLASRLYALLSVGAGTSSRQRAWPERAA